MSFECFDSVISPNSTIYDAVKIRRSTVNDNATIGERCDISDCNIGVRAELGRGNLLRSVEIDYGSYTGTNTIIKKAKIGKYSSISWNVSIGGDNHPMDCASMYSNYWWNRTFSQKTERIEDSKTTFIGNDVWIGANATILSGITVEDGAVIGAGAVVTKDVPAYAVVAGVPAKVIKYRFSQETISVLKEIKWWNWPVERIKESINLLSTPLNKTVLKEIRKRANND